ncbi:MAG: Ig-like domain-containing protein [Armatimonadota bacterium]
MMRAALLGVLLLLLSASVGLAQEPAATSSDAAESGLPDFGARTVAGEAVVDLADFVSSSLAASGSVPELAQVRTADGEFRTLTAAEVFVMLARTAYLWRTVGELPETVTITPDDVTPPALDAEDLVSPPDPDFGREVPTEQFLAQSPAVVRWVDRLRVIPTAVWVNGSRLSAADYLAGLAICIGHAYWDGELADSIFLPVYAPPQSWVAEAQTEYAGREYAGEEASEGEEPLYGGMQESVSSGEGDGEYSEEAQPIEPSELEQLEGQGEEEGWDSDYDTGYDEDGGDDWAYEEEEGAPDDYQDGAGDEGETEYAPEAEGYEEPAPPPPAIPVRLAVSPEPGDTVSGVVDLIASYSGPPARFVVFTIDSRSDVIMDAAPYSYRWDTTELEPGAHQVRVQVLGEDDAVLADQTSAYTVAAPPKRK